MAAEKVEGTISSGKPAVPGEIPQVVIEEATNAQPRWLLEVLDNLLKLRDFYPVGKGPGLL